MQTRQLQYFLAVADHGGFARAAEALRIAQPSLSQAIAAFERELGTPLFHRVGRGVVLSSSGRDLVGPARAVLRSLEHAESSVGSRARAGWDHLDLISTPTPGVEPLTAFLAEFARARPRTKLDVAVGFTPADVVEAIRSGEREIGVLGSPAPRVFRGLRSVDLAPQPFVLISPPSGTPSATGTPGAPDTPGAPGSGPSAEPARLPPTVDLADLTGARLIVPQRGSLIRAAIDALIEDGSLDAEIVAEVSLRASIVPMVLAGIGQAVLASGWTDLAEQAGAVVQTLTPITAIHISVVSRERDLTPAAEAFMQLVSA